MKLIAPSWEIWDQYPGLEGIYKQIERAGRVCYKSENNIKEGSAKKMVDALIKNGHTAVLEHGTVYLKIEDSVDEMGRVHYPVIKGCYNYNPYCKVVSHHYEQKPDEFQKEFCESISRLTEYITTNLRVLVENNWLDDLKFLCEPTEYHEKRVTAKLITNIGVTREGNRHRVNSICEESTRYCNYMKEKFGMSVTFCPPTWFNKENCFRDWENEPIYFTNKKNIGNGVYGFTTNNEDITWTAEDYFMYAAAVSEFCYDNLLKLGKTPQEARAVLLLSTKTEVVYTAYVSDWAHFFKLRADGVTGKPHPDIEVLAKPLKAEFIKRGYLK